MEQLGEGAERGQGVGMERQQGIAATRGEPDRDIQKDGGRGDQECANEPADAVARKEGEREPAGWTERAEEGKGKTERPPEEPEGPPDGPRG